MTAAKIIKEVSRQQRPHLLDSLHPLLFNTTKMVHKMGKNVLIILIILLLSAHIGARDLNIGVSYGGYYSDNIFMNATAVRDYVCRFQADLNYSINKFNLFLDASTGIYNENSEFNSYNIEPGIEFLHYLKKEGRDSLYLNLSYVVLNYRELYRDFNYSGPLFQAGVRLYTSPQTLLKAGYLAQSRNYPNYASFDFSNQTAFVEINRFFKSQTTLRLQAGINYRYYPHVADEYDAGENYNYYNPSHGNMNGNSGQNSNSQPAPRSHTTAVPNFYGLLRAAQGIGTRFGITGEAEFRHNFRGLDDADALIKNAYIIYPYNDNYLWDGLRLTVILKAVLFREFSLEGRFSYFAKDYPGISVMDEEGNVSEPIREREDVLLLANFNLKKQYRKFDISANFTLRDNNSNDDYFFYKMLTIYMGIGYYF